MARDLQTVHFNGLRLTDDENSPLIRMGIQPLLSKQGNLTHFMITFSPLELSTTGKSTELHVGEVSSDRMRALEADLNLMRENLQTTIEELETSNEELQATNEEMIASNEELQSTNEELHSVNEELYTVNGEYQKKIVELTELTDDMNHLFEHLDAGLLFLDSELNVRKFTPSVEEVFSLLPQDVGRSFGSFTHRLDRPQLSDDILSVIKTQKPFEKEVKSSDGRWYLMQIQPYRSRGRIDGVVLELFEITMVKQNRQQLSRAVAHLQTSIEQLDVPIAVKNLEGTYTQGNQAFADNFRTSVDHLIRKTDHDLVGETIAGLLEATCQEAIDKGKTISTEPFRMDNRDERLTATFTPIRDEAGVIDAVCVRLKPI